LVDIINIWSEAFGDDPEFPRRLLCDCGLLKNGLAAECDGRAVSFVLLYPGLELGNCVGCYLYALCTKPEYTGRGIGSALVGFAADTARGLGCDALLLQPGDDGLERWYAGMGFRSLWRSRWESIDISGLEAAQVREIDAGEFLRELGEDRQITPDILASQQAINEIYGGTFLRTDKGLVCAELDGAVLRIRYASCGENELGRIAAAAARGFCVQQASRLCRDDEKGDIALMGLALKGELPILSEDSFFPFTLS